MSLKEHTKEIYAQYGLTDVEFETYMVFLSYPQFTVSEVAGVLNKEETSEEIQQIADKLEKINFIKKIPGIVDRYVPCEPYLELFNSESKKFREIISNIKDNVLTDQSSRFESLSKIEDTTNGGIQNSVKTQVETFFRESDTQDLSKSDTISSARTRFTDTSNSLITDIRSGLFESRDNFTQTRSSFSDNVKKQTEGARDRFTQTSQNLENDIQEGLFKARDHFTDTCRVVENNLQEILEKGRDRYTDTSLTLEKELHSHLDAENQNLQDKVNASDSDADKLWDAQNSKFSLDNKGLNTDIEKFSNGHVEKSKAIESEIHSTIDTLNGDLKKISDEFQSIYDSGIQSQKSGLNKLMDDLLHDFAERVQNLETEIKSSLDNYMVHHRENAEDLKPNLEEILEKNILRMKKTIDDLKSKFSKLLHDHYSHAEKVNDDISTQLIERVETRNSQLAGQVLEFKKNTVELMDNLKDTSDRYEELAKNLAKRGSAWKSLLFGTHKKYKANYNEIKERVASISGNMKSTFEESTALYIQATGKTTTDLIQEIKKITEEKNSVFQTEVKDLDKNQQNTLDVQLEGIAGDLSETTDKTLQNSVKAANDTTGKLKDKVETSFHSHHDDFDMYLNKHRKTILDFDDQRNGNTKETVSRWYGDMDREHVRVKQELSTEIANHVRDVQDHLSKSTDTHNKHSDDFMHDVELMKKDQRSMLNDLLHGAEEDIRGCKTSVSEKLHSEIDLIKSNVKDMDHFQKETLEKQILVIADEFEAKNTLQISKLNEQIQLFQEEVNAINQKQQEQIDAHIKTFQELVGKLDKRQTDDLTKENELFIEECKQMEESLHVMLENHKASYNENASNLQEQLIKTISDTTQDTKDAIADFTLTFMNSIDESNDVAESNENHLKAISVAAMKVPALGESSTWHVFGKRALIEKIIAAMYRTKSTITIVSPSVEPKILEALSQMAYKRKSARFLYTTNWDMGTFGEIIEKMKMLGNIQFRNLKNANDFFAISRDGEEIVLCPQAKKEEDYIAIVSIQEGYAQIFGSFIYPIFQANSRPI